MRRFFFLALATTLLVGALSASVIASEPAAGPEEPTYIFLVRHAEKQKPEVSEEPRNPRLTEAGEARATTLAHMLGEAGIEVVLSTPLHRTLDTAAPIAEVLGLEVAITPIVENYAASVADRIRADHRGQRVLVVGHSNTTPGVIAALGVDAGDVPNIEEHEYDDLFLVVLQPGGEARLTRLRYGVETP